MAPVFSLHAFSNKREKAAFIQQSASLGMAFRSAYIAKNAFASLITSKVPMHANDSSLALALSLMSLLGNLSCCYFGREMMKEYDITF